jgi:hypothetical protein
VTLLASWCAADGNGEHAAAGRRCGSNTTFMPKPAEIARRLRKPRQPILDCEAQVATDFERHQMIANGSSAGRRGGWSLFPADRLAAADTPPFMIAASARVRSHCVGDQVADRCLPGRAPWHSGYRARPRWW